jgi:hypothetical protein
MRRSTRARADIRALDNARMEYLFRRAAVAAVLFDPIATEALLDLPDAEVGRRFKISLARVMGVATVMNLDLHALREQDEKQLSKPKCGTNRQVSPRDALVAEGKLLRGEIICEALGITERRLNKDVARGRIFSVDVKAEQYYPAFFLANELDPKELAKVVRRLDGLAGWSKWDFFTQPKESLGSLTPLQALLQGELKQVLRTAAAFVER